MRSAVRRICSRIRRADESVEHRRLRVLNDHGRIRLHPVNARLLGKRLLIGLTPCWLVDDWPRHRGHGRRRSHWDRRRHCGRRRHLRRDRRPRGGGHRHGSHRCLRREWLRGLRHGSLRITEHRMPRGLAPRRRLWLLLLLLLLLRRRRLWLRWRWLIPRRPARALWNGRRRTWPHAWSARLKGKRLRLHRAWDPGERHCRRSGTACRTSLRRFGLFVVVLLIHSLLTTIARRRRWQSERLQAMASPQNASWTLPYHLGSCGHPVLSGSAVQKLERLRNVQFWLRTTVASGRQGRLRRVPGR